MGGLTYYSMTELVEDDALTTAQKNLYESKVQQARSLTSTLSFGKDGRSRLSLRIEEGEAEGVTIQQSKGDNSRTSKAKRAKMATRTKTVAELMVQNLVKQEVGAADLEPFESLAEAKALVRKIATRASAEPDAEMVGALAQEL